MYEELEKLSAREPLARLILRFRFSRSLWKTAIFVLFLNFLSALVLPYFLHGLWTTSNYVGTLDDIPSLINAFVVIPINVVYFLWIANTQTSFLRNLLAHTEECYYNNIQCAKEIDWIRRYFSSWQVSAFIILMTSLLVLSSIYVSLYEYIKPTWGVHYKWVFWGINLPLIAIGEFSFSGGIVYAFIFFYNVIKICNNFTLIVDPFHPDRVGGLRFIGERLIKVNTITISLTAFFVGEIIAAFQRGHGFKQYNVIGEMIAMPLLTIFLFFIPLSFIYQAMRRSREKFFNGFSKILTRKYQLLFKGDMSKQEVSDFLSLLDLYSRLYNSFPLLPIDVRIWIQIGRNIVFSLLPSLVGTLLQSFSQT